MYLCIVAYQHRVAESVGSWANRGGGEGNVRIARVILITGGELMNLGSNLLGGAFAHSIVYKNASSDTSATRSETRCYYYYDQ